MFPSLNLKNLLKTAGLFLMQFCLCLGLVSTSSHLATSSPVRLVNHWIAQAAPESLDIDRAADKADDASKNIYEGLDTTKRIVGKTDKRNQVIEQARAYGSIKWKSLSEKAKETQNSDASLTPTEQKVLKQVED